MSLQGSVPIWDLVRPAEQPVLWLLLQGMMPGPTITIGQPVQGRTRHG